MNSWPISSARCTIRTLSQRSTLLYSSGRVPRSPTLKLTPGLQLTILLIMAAAGMVLAVACANVPVCKWLVRDPARMNCERVYLLEPADCALLGNY